MDEALAFSGIMLAETPTKARLAKTTADFTIFFKVLILS
ncbi:hypothetical protein NT04LS_2948 [Listeria seeligeri FSL S4-171]|nr:hypothetical protein NT04LS_2948 [Listeria seeligeri FSL S4-171]